MPFINTKTNVSISKEQQVLLKEEFGNAITLLGKSENWLMLSFEDNKNLWFQGKNDKPLAMVEIALYGKANNSQYDAMTEKVCQIINGVLGISQDCIYVKYEEVDHWGYNGFNF